MKNIYIKTIIISVAVLIFIGISFCGAKASDVNQDNLFNIINSIRTERGLVALKGDPDLNNAALLKTKDMLNRNYFDHYAFGLTPWNFMKMAGYDYLYAGENLAMDFNTSEGMVDAWMNSKTHRDNILNPDYSEIGIGVIKGAYIENGSKHETIMVTNMFGRKKPAIIKWFNNLTQNFSNIF